MTVAEKNIRIKACYCVEFLRAVLLRAVNFVGAILDKIREKNVN